jgi:hypothetical protein
VGKISEVRQKKEISLKVDGKGGGKVEIDEEKKV